MNIKRSISFDDETFKKVELLRKYYGMTRSEFIRFYVNIGFEETQCYEDFQNYMKRVGKQ